MGHDRFVHTPHRRRNLVLLSLLLLAAVALTTLAVSGCRQSPAETSGQGSAETDASAPPAGREQSRQRSRENSAEGRVRPEEDPGQTLVRYAEGFDLEPVGADAWLLTIRQPWPGARAGAPPPRLVYVLRPRAAQPGGTDGSREVERSQRTGSLRDADSLPPDAVEIEIPLQSIATLSASFLAPLEMLGVTGSWVGHDQPRRVYAQWAQRRVAAGAVARVGDGANVDVERLLSLQPDLVMINEYEPDGPTHSRLRSAGLAVLVNGDWLETTPLGRAEWIKVFGALYDRMEDAVSLFAEVEQQYNGLRQRATELETRPTVLSNAPYGGIWSLPAGESYTARLFEDAGGDYLWAHTEGAGALHIDLERVFVHARDADVWINPGAWESLRDGRQQDARLAAFHSFQQGEVFNFDRRTTEQGGNDYFESGPYRPHVVLADLIRILHPELLPDHELFYYRRVPE